MRIHEQKSKYKAIDPIALIQLKQHDCGKNSTARGHTSSNTMDLQNLDPR
jgi:hypothetical protein